MKEKKLNVAFGVLLFISAFFMVFLCSATTSPLFPYYKGWDSGLFQVIGKGWNHGFIPYKDLYDQKGPALFFIEKIGYMISGNKYGVFSIQVLFAFVSEVVVFLILRRHFNPFPAAIITALGYFYFSANYEYGNLCEEYANPLLLFCLFLMTKWLYEKSCKKEDHDPVYAAFYGITFGFCMMSRLTNAIYVCMFVFVIIVYLCINKKWINLLHNAIGFILGTCLIVLLFMIYFAVKNSTYDFWYGTILYNFSYANNSKGGIATIIKGALGQVGSYAIIAAGILNILKKDYFKGIMFGSLGIITELLLMSIMNFGHYSMITFPLLPIALCELKRLFDDDKGLVKRLAFILMIFVLLVTSLKTFKEINKLKGTYDRFSASASGEASVQYNQLLDFVDKIPLEERNSVVGYGTNPWFYLDMDITPACRFFVMQDWQAEFSESFSKLLIEEFEEKKPLWIVVYKESKELSIKQIIENNYEAFATEDVVDSSDGEKLILYRLK